MLFARLDNLLDGKSPASTLFSGPYYMAEQLGFRKIIDNTFMIATMINGDPDPEDLRKFFRALKRAQRDIDLRPDLYTHYYKNEFPVRYHAQMDTRRWGPGERLVFEPYTKEVYDETFKWIADHGIFADTGMGSGTYEEAVIRAGVADARLLRHRAAHARSECVSTERASAWFETRPSAARSPWREGCVGTCVSACSPPPAAR